MSAYYNEIDAYAAAWLRNLIAAGHIAPGDVDTRSIVEVQPDDVRGYTQAHFFAGIGVWSHAARLAGVADSDRIWTGSCPCQPFSAAGKQRGTDDERHLWPEFHRLIRECRPPIVLGEQVASALGRQWLGAVRADLEALGYAVGAADLGAASVGAPHIRQRLWWVGHAKHGGRERRFTQWQGPSAAMPSSADGSMADAAGQRLQGGKRARRRSDAQQPSAERGGAPGWMAHHNQAGRSGEPAARLHGRWPGARGDEPAAPNANGASGHDADRCGTAGILADAAPGGRREQRDAMEPGQGRHADGGGDASGRLADASGAGVRDSGPGAHDGAARGVQGEGLQRQRVRHDAGPDNGGPLHGFWSDAEWIPCRDGKARPVEPGTFPLAHGAPARVGRLRAYGNAIVAPLAAEFIQAVMECRP